VYANGHIKLGGTTSKSGEDIDVAALDRIRSQVPLSVNSHKYWDKTEWLLHDQPKSRLSADFLVREEILAHFGMDKKVSGEREVFQNIPVNEFDAFLDTLLPPSPEIEKNSIVQINVNEDLRRHRKIYLPTLEYLDKEVRGWYSVPFLKSAQSTRFPFMPNKLTVKTVEWLGNKLSTIGFDDLIMVLYRIEVAFVLQSLGYTNVTVVTHVQDDFLAKKCRAGDLKYDNIAVHEWIEMLKPKVIVSNVPFRVKEGNDPLWQASFDFCARNVAEGGAVLFISPDTWSSPSKERGAEYKILDRLTSKEFNLQHVWFDLKDYWSEEKTKPGVSISAMLFTRSSYEGRTKIDGSSDHDLSGVGFIPMSRDPLEISIVKKVVEWNDRNPDYHPRFKFIMSEIKTVDKQDTDHTIPYLNTSSSPASGTHVQYGTHVDSKAKIGIPKVHMTYIASANHPVVFTVDVSGKYGSNRNGCVWDINPSQYGEEYLNSIFTSKLTKLLMRNIWTQYAEPRIANMLPLIGDGFQPVTDQQIYGVIGLNDPEINYIESME
jgi:hypothetical protein